MRLLKLPSKYIRLFKVYMIIKESLFRPNILKLGFLGKVLKEVRSQMDHIKS